MGGIAGLARGPSLPSLARCPPAPSPSCSILDGTLVDTIALILRSVRHAFEGRAWAPTDAQWVAGIGQPLRVQLGAFADGAGDVEALVERYRAYQQEHHDGMTRAYPGAVEAVRRLKALGHPIGVVTGKLSETAARALSLVGLAPFVDVLVGADSCQRHKPDPEPVLLALARLGREPREALFLGDSTIDLQAARAAGVRAVAALWGACSREALLEAGPQHLLDDVRDLPALVERLRAEAR